MPGCLNALPAAGIPRLRVGSSFHSASAVLRVVEAPKGLGMGADAVGTDMARRGNYLSIRPAALSYGGEAVCGNDVDRNIDISCLVGGLSASWVDSGMEARGMKEASRHGALQSRDL